MGFADREGERLCRREDREEQEDVVLSVDNEHQRHRQKLDSHLHPAGSVWKGEIYLLENTKLEIGSWSCIIVRYWMILLGKTSPAACRRQERCCVSFFHRKDKKS